MILWQGTQKMTYKAYNNKDVLCLSLLHYPEQQFLIPFQIPHHP
jgi:hypothetical protein